MMVWEKAMEICIVRSHYQWQYFTYTVIARYEEKRASESRLGTVREAAGETGMKNVVCILSCNGCRIVDAFRRQANEKEWSWIERGAALLCHLRKMLPTSRGGIIAVVSRIPWCFSTVHRMCHASPWRHDTMATLTATMHAQHQHDVLASRPRHCQCYTI